MDMDSPAEHVCTYYLPTTYLPTDPTSIVPFASRATYPSSAFAPLFETDDVVRACVRQTQPTTHVRRLVVDSSMQTGDMSRVAAC
jgi:hypothetical protein